jgi:uncharacterized membrane protein YgdD (TMEM256/DUF423 family)
MRKTFLRTGSILAFLAVGLGALGAHALKGILSPERLISFETGVRYHLIHALAILIVAALLHFGKKQSLVISGWLFFAGVILFSGSIYLLTLQDVLAVNLSFLGPVTPIGGVLMMAGWVMLAVSSYQHAEHGHGKTGKDKPE